MVQVVFKIGSTVYKYHINYAKCIMDIHIPLHRNILVSATAKPCSSDPAIVLWVLYRLSIIL